MGDLSPNFSRSEFRSRDGASLPSDQVLLRLVSHLEVLRCLAGHKPMRIVSGHRSVAHNMAVGGVRASRHLVGDAVDLELGYCTVAQARAAGFGGIGTQNGRVRHVDLRTVPASWTY